ncbi:hypothetical protein STEG23_019059, partial [Scotinomys teguina]
MGRPTLTMHSAIRTFDKAFSLPEALGISAKPDLPKTFRFQVLPIYMREKPDVGSATPKQLLLEQ